MQRKKTGITIHQLFREIKVFYDLPIGSIFFVLKKRQQPNDAKLMRYLP